MRTYRTKEFVQYLQSSVGSNSNTDMMYRWIEEALTEIRSLPWSWNWKIDRQITTAPITESAGTFTWTTGQDYITCSSNMTDILYGQTGRVVKLGDRWYQCVDCGITNAARIYMSRRIVSSSTAATSLTFHRDHKYFKTSKIRNVAVGNVPKCGRYSSDSLRQFWLLSDVDDLEDGTPYSYQDIVVERITPPAHPPLYASSGGGSFANGKYVYFYTKYDSESRLESEPGPHTVVDVTDTFRPTITYNNPAAADALESSSYTLRLYRSEVLLPTDKRPRLRVPMFLVQERSPASGSYTDDNDSGILRGKARYWDGAYSGVRLLPKPSIVERFDVECLDDCGGRLHDEEYIGMGKNDEVMQLIRLYVSGVSKLKSLGATEYHQHLIAFRRQSAHLLSMDREPGNADPGPKQVQNYSNDLHGTGDWVEGLQSPWSQS